MPKVIWLAQENRTAEQQQAAEWRIAKKHLTGKPPGTQLNPKSGKKKKAYEDPETGEKVTLTHRYLVGGEGEIFVKSNGQALGQGICGEVTFGQTEDGRMWAIKESSTKPKNSQEGEIAVDLGKAKNYFKYQDKHYQIYHFLGTPLDKYLRENTLSEDKQYNLAIKITQAIYHLHKGTHSKNKIQYAHLDLKPQNICIDDLNNIHLIDYGFSEPLQGMLEDEKGTLIYLPFSSSNLLEWKKSELDIYALLRVLYFPEKTTFLGRVCHRPHAHLPPCVFNHEVLSKSLFLKNLLDTTDGKLKDISIVNIICELILYKNNLISKENIKKINTNPDQFERNYHSLEIIGCTQQAYIQKVIDNPTLITQLEKYKDIFLKLNQIELNQSIYIEYVLANPALIIQFEKYQDIFLKLNQLELNQYMYIEYVLTRPEEFNQNYQHLEDIGLNNRVYIQQIISDPSLLTQLKKYKDELLKLKKFGLNESLYINQVINNGDIFNLNFQRLEAIGLNQQTHIKKLCNHLDQFTFNYQRLKELGLDQPSYVQKMLDHPERFDQHYQQLVGLGLNQQPYVQKVLDDPSVIPQLEQNKNEFLKLNRTGLNKLAYIEQILANPNQFVRHYQCLINTRLNSPHNIEKILKLPEQFEQGYQYLKAFKLDQTNHTGAMLDHLPRSSEHCQQLKNLGLNQASDLARMLDHVPNFEQDYPTLVKLREIYDYLSGQIASDQLKVQGMFAEGVEINFKGQSKLIPRGIGKIWLEIADEQGNFYWMRNVSAALTNSTDQARRRCSARQQEEGQTPSLFFAAYRAHQTQAAYDRISQLP
ncbi:protein kinase domain-containing protein [Piscirickettsia salmonis]|uniref:protein kinase domain-containing protein n=1 Tax=Piscirickettsia salmonis TaxID=1238 RepID=UPI003EBB4BC7